MLTYIDKIKQLLNGSKERRAISSNIYWLFTEQAIRFILGFLVSIWVVRYLGPEDYGIFTYSLAFTGIIGTFIGLGLGNIIIRELVRSPEKQNELLGLSLLLYFLSAIVALIVCLSAIYFLRGTDHQTVSLVSILALGYLLKPFQVIGLYFESKVLGKMVVPFIIIGLVISNFLKIYFVFQEGSLSAFAWITLVEGLISSVGMYYLFRKSNLSLKLNWNKNIKLTKKLIKDSLPLMLSSFMIVIYMKVDQIMLREMVSAEELGLYSVAVVLTSIWFFIPTIITRSFFPKMVASMERDKVLFEQQLQKLYNLIALVGYVICIPFAFLADYIVPFLYGEAFSEAGGMLSIMIWTAFFMGFGVVRGAYVYAMNLTKVHLVITIIGAIGNIILNLILIPKHQGFGAVLATLISQIFACFLSSFIFRSLRQNGIMMVKATLYPKIL